MDGTMTDLTMYDAAMRGDEASMRRLVFSGADVNRTDAEGRSVIALLVIGARSLKDADQDAAQVISSAPARLATLSFLLDQRRFSLYTLNVPQEALNGLTPLGMSAYLNRKDFVSALLDKGDGLVLLDGVDLHRATPVMYAARDGHVEVVQYLLNQGARPDAADCHHRSALFYALSDPHCLWVCEKSLRQRRAQSLLSPKIKRKLRLSLQLNDNAYIALASLYQHPSVLTLAPEHINASVQPLISAIRASDHSAVHTLLFPSPSYNSPDSHASFTSPSGFRPRSSSLTAPCTLANLPDASGWAPIHHCCAASHPSKRVLDALFLAGADLSLYTQDNTASPLHILARAQRGSTFHLYSFITHLVRDLGAPLSARDLDGNTCVHVAALAGHSLDALMAFLDCDTSGEVRKLRNNEGLTAFDIAKPEFRVALGSEENFMRPASAASVRTIRPSTSSASLASTSSVTSTTSSSSDSSSDSDVLTLHEQFPPRRKQDEEGLRSTLFTSADAEELLENLKQLTSELERLERDEDDILEEDATCEKIELEDVEALLHGTWRSASEILERFRQLVDLALNDLRAAREVREELEHVIDRLESRIGAESIRGSTDDDEVATEIDEEEHEHRDDGLGVLEPRVRPRPSVGSFTSISTPTLSGSASSSSTGSFASLASFTSFASFADPEVSVHDPTDVDSSGHDMAWGWRSQTEREDQPINDDENEVDFALACRLAAGKHQSLQGRIQSSRHGSAQSLLISHEELPSSSLEVGLNLVSVPPASTVGSGMSGVDVSNLESGVGLGISGVGPAANSWLDPFVRKANSETFQAHLENLLEIERTLFGDDDEAADQCNLESLGTSQEQTEADLDWREGVENLHLDSAEDAEGVEGDWLENTNRRTALYEPDINFLDMFAPSDPVTVNPRSPSPRSVFEAPPSVLSILEMARLEVASVEATINEADRSIDGAQRYLTQAERLTNRIFQAKEHALQATRLSNALQELCEGDEELYLRGTNEIEYNSERCSTPELCNVSRAPASSPIAQRSTAAVDLFFASTEFTSSAMSRRPSVQSLCSLASGPSSAFPTRASFSTPSATNPDDTRMLRRLLVRKIPARLEGAFDEVDRAGTWVGVLQEVVRNLRRQHAI